MKPVTAGASAPVQILDCTLRDGGYYNDWDYAFDLVSRYVDAMAAARIDVCELGFRTLATDKYLGATAFTTDEFIDAVNVPASLQLAVMLNAKEINAAADPRVTLRRHFAPRSRSKVSLVRIAATVNEVDALGPAIDELRDLGYDVALNLMQVTDRPLADVTAFGRKAKAFGSKYAYVADSFGSLRPSGVRPIISALIDGFGPEVGCHLHDNMSYALANTMEAVAAGVVIADATVQGMGRGPGNVRTEYLVMELASLGRTNAVVAPLVNLVERDFADLRRTYEWGSNLYYFMSANRSIHPTYVMELTKDDRYSPTEIVGALDKLGERGASNFDIRRLTEAVEGSSLRYAGGANVAGWCTAREVLLVGNGPEARAKRAEIEMFIRRHSPFVVGLNAHVPIDPSLLDAVVVCHPERAVMDAVALSALTCEVVAPAELLRELGISVKTLRDVGVSVEQNTMGKNDHGVVIPQPVVAGYALALAHQGEAKRIWLAGLDGYADGDPRQAMMLDTLRSFGVLAPDTAVVSITRTSYPVRQQSIFAP